jgi:preprotein translocase subunit SecF
MSRIKIYVAVVATLIIMVCGAAQVKAQGMPEVFDEGTLDEQFDYLQQRTTIYNNFRAIREDMFRKLRRNSLDSLNRAFQQINSLQQQISRQEQERSRLQDQLDQTLIERDDAVAGRDNLSFLGMEMNKSTFNTIILAVMGILVVILLILAVLYQRANSVASQKSREMNELQAEYEEYRKTSRERFERQSIEHFNELKRLRGI